jgi:hypothetical protein
MALADNPPGRPPRRLDSWKEIAEYLRRDVRTATRWEAQGLPLHRVAGGKGRSVFAFTNEIDAWMARRPIETEPAVVVTPPVAVASPVPPQASPRSFRTLATVVTSAVVVIGIGAAVNSGRGATLISQLETQVTRTATHVAITDASGVPRVIHQFAAGARLGHTPDAQLDDINGDGSPEILAAVDYYADKTESLTGPGELFQLSTTGDVHWRFSFDDVLSFGERKVTGPWALTDWQAEPYAPVKRIAIAAHEESWWASLVTVLDHTGRRLGDAFVNPGWIESVLWQSPDRLAVAGFNNDRNAGMLAILDANHLGGQAPGIASTKHACISCSPAGPVFYATFTRSEVNLVGAGGFLRTRVTRARNHLVVQTSEFSRAPSDATGIYEFDRDQRLVTATYSDAYWDEHVRLEREGRLTHSRDKCPERDGPAAIHVWDAARGWVRITPSGR